MYLVWCPELGEVEPEYESFYDTETPIEAINQWAKSKNISYGQTATVCVKWPYPRVTTMTHEEFSDPSGIELREAAQAYNGILRVVDDNGKTIMTCRHGFAFREMNYFGGPNEGETVKFVIEGYIIPEHIGLKIRELI